MTVKEWHAKRMEALQQWKKERDSGETNLSWESWRATKGYVVDHEPGMRPTA